MPEAFLQVLRPYLDSKHDYDAAFAQAFAVPEFRTVSGRAAEAASRLLSIMAAYEGLPEEVAARLLSSRVLLERVSNQQTDEEVREAFEHALGEETGALAREASTLRGELESILSEREMERIKTKEREKKAAIQEQELRTAVEREREARALEARKSERERKVEQKTNREQYEAQLTDAQRNAALEVSALNTRLGALEDANTVMRTQLDKKERRDVTVRSFFTISIGVVLASAFLWAAHLGPLKMIQRHANAWTIEATVSLMLIAAFVSIAKPKWRRALWISLGVGALLVLIQALGGSPSISEKELLPK